MIEDTLYFLNQNDGIDTLHTEHGDERCNRDDVKGKQLIDEKTAKALKDGGYVRSCAHCKPLEDES